MMTYNEILDAAITDSAGMANDAVQRGQGAARVLGDHTVREFFTQHTSDLVRALMACDTSKLEEIRTIVIGIRSLGALHNSLTQAVTAGLVAAERLQEQANEEKA